MGIETTSAALAVSPLVICAKYYLHTSFQFAIRELSTHRHIQTKLRQEVLSTPKDMSYDELMRLPYLDSDAFTREILRVDAPVPEAYREALEDDIIPTSMPSFSANGKLVDSIHIKKGQVIILPLLEINRSEALWGPTAREFDPERWLHGNLPPSAEAIHSFNHLVTFGDGYVV